MDEFEYLRGWFSVRILNSVISGDLAANPRPDQSLPPDALIQFDPPNLSATRILDRLLPEAGYRGTAENTFSFWTDYVRTHEQELKKLQPTGEGVDFSPRACKNGKPVKKY